MKRTPVAHVVLPRMSRVRPFPEFVLDAARWVARDRSLDLELIVPVPHPALRRVQATLRRGLGRPGWPAGLEPAIRREAEPTGASGKLTLVPYVPLPRRSIESAAVAVAAELLARPRVARPRVIHGSFLDEGGYVAAWAARAIGVGSIAVAHGTDVVMARTGLDGGRARRAAVTLAEATTVVSVCHALARELGQLGRRSTIVPYTAEAERFPATTPPPAGPILFVGRLSRGKGVDLLLEALAGTSAEAQLIGPPSADLDVPRLVDALGLTSRVEVIAELPRAELPSRYAAARCLALPSRSEGLPCVVAEALLVGRPVVATDVGGVAELVDAEVGACVPPDDAGALRSAIDGVLARTWSSEALRARALPFAWERAGPRLQELTRGALDGP